MNKQRLIRCGRDVSLAYGTVVQNDVELPARIRNVLVAAGLSEHHLIALSGIVVAERLAALD